MNTQSPNSNEAAARVESALQEASTAIGAARTLLDQGNIVDLSGLEAHVDRACSEILQLPRDQRQPLKPVLVGLIDGLNALADTLTTQHREVSSALTGLGARRKAVAAYKPVGRK